MSRYQPELICGDLTDQTSGLPIGHVGRGGRGEGLGLAGECIGEGVVVGEEGAGGVLMQRETLGRKVIMGVVIMVVVVMVIVAGVTG